MRAMYPHRAKPPPLPEIAVVEVIRTGRRPQKQFNPTATVDLVANSEMPDRHADGAESNANAVPPRQKEYQ